MPESKHPTEAEVVSPGTQSVSAKEIVPAGADVINVEVAPEPAPLQVQVDGEESPGTPPPQEPPAGAGNPEAPQLRNPRQEAPTTPEVQERARERQILALAGQFASYAEARNPYKDSKQEPLLKKAFKKAAVKVAVAVVVGGLMVTVGHIAVPAAIITLGSGMLGSTAGGLTADLVHRVGGWNTKEEGLRHEIVELYDRINNARAEAARNLLTSQGQENFEEEKYKFLRLIDQQGQAEDSDQAKLDKLVQDYQGRKKKWGWIKAGFELAGGLIAGATSAAHQAGEYAKHGSNISGKGLGEMARKYSVDSVGHHVHRLADGTVVFDYNAGELDKLLQNPEIAKNLGLGGAKRLLDQGMHVVGRELTRSFNEQVSRLADRLTGYVAASVSTEAIVNLISSLRRTKKDAGSALTKPRQYEGVKEYSKEYIANRRAQRVAAPEGRLENLPVGKELSLQKSFSHSYKVGSEDKVLSFQQGDRFIYKGRDGENFILAPINPDGSPNKDISEIRMASDVLIAYFFSNDEETGIVVENSSGEFIPRADDIKPGTKLYLINRTVTQTDGQVIQIGQEASPDGEIFTIVEEVPVEEGAPERPAVFLIRGNVKGIELKLSPDMICQIFRLAEPAGLDQVRTEQVNVAGEEDSGGETPKDVTASPTEPLPLTDEDPSRPPAEPLGTSGVNGESPDEQLDESPEVEANRTDAEVDEKTQQLFSQLYEFSSPEKRPQTQEGLIKVLEEWCTAEYRTEDARKEFDQRKSVSREISDKFRIGAVKRPEGIIVRIYPLPIATEGSPFAFVVREEEGVFRAYYVVREGMGPYRFENFEFRKENANMGGTPNGEKSASKAIQEVFGFPKVGTEIMPPDLHDKKVKIESYLEPEGRAPAKLVFVVGSDGKPFQIILGDDRMKLYKKPNPGLDNKGNKLMEDIDFAGISKIYVVK